jgi:hypothetical protein
MKILALLSGGASAFSPERFELLLVFFDSLLSSSFATGFVVVFFAFPD